MRATSFQQQSTRSISAVVPSAPRFQRRVVAQAGTNGTGAKKPAAKPAAAPSSASTPFTNTNRFKVSPEAVALFEKEWREREANMKKFAGFQGFSIKKDGDKYVTASTWASIPEWEAWSLSEEARRSHLPLGVWQWVPAKGEGFPEDFTFIIDYNEPIKAQY